MHRFRSWTLDPPEYRTQRNRLLPIEGGDGSTLNLDFTTGVLDPRLTLTRGTNATFINSSGLVQYADANYVQNSNDVTASGWTIQNGATRSFDNAVVNPEGGLGASLVTASSSIGSSAVNTSSFTVNGGLTYTVSFWIRAGTATQALVGVYDPSIPPSGAFTPASALVISGPGSASGSSSIVVSGLTSSWTRVRIYLSPAYSGSRAVSIYPDAALASGKSIYIWGVKWEAGHVANPTQITTGATAYHAPRFDYDPTTLAPRGLLIEGSASNLLFWSQDVTQATKWTVQGSPGSYASISATGGTAPDGTNTANLCTEGTGSGSRSIYQSISPAAGPYTFSIWAKAGSGSARFVRLVISSAAGNFVYVTVSLANGSITQAATAVGTASAASATVTPYTGSWYKITLTGTFAAALNFVFIVPTDSGTASVNTADYGRYTYTGDGSSFLIWGAQLEAGSGASSYIPTGASQGLRNPDYCVMDGISSFFTSQSSLTMLIDATPRFQSGFPALWRLTDAGNSNSYELYYTSSGTNNTYATKVAVGGVSSGESNFANSIAQNTRQIMGYAIASGVGFRSRNGVSASAQIPTSLPSAALTRLGIGSSGLSANPSTAHIRRIKYWPYAMTQDQLNGVTTP